MKRMAGILSVILCCISLIGCTAKEKPAQIVATTLPVYEFTQMLCNGTDLKVQRLINEDIACLHDYSLQVSQMQALESADIVLSSGASLEDFLEDVKTEISDVVDLSSNIPLLFNEDHHHDDHDSADPHYWLSPTNSKIMAANICKALIVVYPQHQNTFEKNLNDLNLELDKLQNYADSQLTEASCRKLVTFHDGFSYMADAFNLEIVHSISEESGSEASAKELIELSNIIEKNSISAVFTEKNGATTAANIVANEMQIKIYCLDMAMSGNSYFDAMYHNIDTLKEALE